MTYADLVENFNALCAKCNKAIERANNEIAKRGCLEIENADLKHEMKLLLQENADLKYALVHSE